MREEAQHGLPVDRIPPVQNRLVSFPTEWPVGGNSFCYLYKSATPAKELEQMFGASLKTGLDSRAKTPNLQLQRALEDGAGTTVRIANSVLRRPWPEGSSCHFLPMVLARHKGQPGLSHMMDGARLFQLLASLLIQMATETSVMCEHPERPANSIHSRARRNIFPNSQSFLVR